MYKRFKVFKNNIVNHQEPNEVYTTIEISNNKSIIHELDVLEKSNLTNEIEIINSDHITKELYLV